MNKALVLYNNNPICNNIKGLFLYYSNILFMYYMVYQFSVLYNIEIPIIIYDLEDCSLIDHMNNIVCLKRKRLFLDNIYLDRCLILYDNFFDNYDFIYSMDSDILIKDNEKFKELFNLDIQYFSGIPYKNKFNLDCILATINTINVKECRFLYKKDHVIDVINEHKKKYENCYNCNNEERIFGELFIKYNYNNYKYFDYIEHFNNDKLQGINKKIVFTKKIFSDTVFDNYMKDNNNYNIIKNKINSFYEHLSV